MGFKKTLEDDALWRAVSECPTARRGQAAGARKAVPKDRRHREGRAESGETHGARAGCSAAAGHDEIKGPS